MSLMEMCANNNAVMKDAVSKQKAENKKTLPDLKIGDKPTAAIISPVSLNTIDYVGACASMIEYQTYGNITQWIVVATIDHSKRDYVEKSIKDAVQKYKRVRNMLQLEFLPEVSVFDATNHAHSLLKADIAVSINICDFFTPDRIQRMIKTIVDVNSPVIIQICPFVYDIDLDKIYQARIANERVSLFGTFAYATSYTKNHRFGTSNNYNKNLMDFLHNTKGELEVHTRVQMFDLVMLDLNRDFREEILLNYRFPEEKRSMVECSYQFFNFIRHPKTLEIYKLLLPNHSVCSESPYDVVYYCGLSLPWNPRETNLGGSEQAIHEIAKSYQQAGKKVAVYTTLNIDKDEETFDDVHYYKAKYFDLAKKYNMLILWRPNAWFPWLAFKPKCNKLVLDVHDNFIGVGPAVTIMIDNVHNIDHVMLKSNYHLKCLEMFSKQHKVDEKALAALIGKSVVIPNGVRIEQFKSVPDPKPQREPYRFCYTSCYTRGLKEILIYIWPIIKENIPEAELHVYYGMDMVGDGNFKQEMQFLLNYNGVYDHGRCDRQEIIREKHTSTWHLYFSYTLAETDCIAIRESLAAGCIPLISQANVFSERDGVHLNTSHTPDAESFKSAGEAIVKLAKLPPVQLLQLSEQFKKSNTLLTWQQIGEQWMQRI